MNRILIADDQIPESHLTSEEAIMKHYTDLYKDPGFSRGFVFLYQLIKELRSMGFQVDTVNRQEDLVGTFDKHVYNAIVLDLGWWTEQKMNIDDKMVLGWKLADTIRTKSAAPIIMFSNRFYEDPELGKTAAEKGLLPVYKSYSEECLRQILVTIRFAVMSKGIKELISEKQKLYAFEMYQRLSKVLLGTITASVVLLLIAVVMAAINLTQATVVSSIFGVVSTFINGAIFKYIKQYKRDFA